jgi:hypothetical protein
MNLDLALMGIECEEIPQAPQQPEDRQDNFFEASDYGLSDEADADTFAKRSTTDDAEVILMHLPRGKVARVTKSQVRACKTDAEHREFNRSLYRSVGLDPAAYWI